MDLTAPLQSLIPTLDGAALTVLAGTESALGQSQIHRLAPRGTRSGLALVLDRLVEHGIVLAEPTNYGYLYRLNRDHVLAPAILAASAAREEFLRRLSDACTQLKPTVLSAALFGSVARRDSAPASDVDLLLVVPDNFDTGSPEWQEQIRALTERAQAWSGNRLEIITVTGAHLVGLAARGEPIVTSWQADALTLTGADLHTLVGGPQEHDPSTRLETHPWRHRDTEEAPDADGWAGGGAAGPVRHPQIVQVGAHYGTQVHTCVPYDPQSKGGAEATVRIAKADLVPTEANLR